jgi:hypothetical protein
VVLHPGRGPRGSELSAFCSLTSLPGATIADLSNVSTPIKSPLTYLSTCPRGFDGFELPRDPSHHHYLATGLPEPSHLRDDLPSMADDDRAGRRPKRPWNHDSPTRGDDWHRASPEKLEERRRHNKRRRSRSPSRHRHDRGSIKNERRRHRDRDLDREQDGDLHRRDDHQHRRRHHSRSPRRSHHREHRAPRSRPSVHGIATISPDPSTASASATPSQKRASPRSSLDGAPPPLPYGARALSRWDFAAFEPLFAHYLDVQKGLTLAALAEEQVRGRWKSFVGRWNRGELAEGWYAPEMFLRVVKMRALGSHPSTESGMTGLGIQGQAFTPPVSGRSVPDSGIMMMDEDDEAGGHDESSDDDAWGPIPPGKGRGDLAAARQGPGIPSLADLQVREEAVEEEKLRRIEDLRLARRADRAEQRSRLEELVPRAAAGTRERALEKRREAGAAARAYREGRDEEPEMGDGELMGEDGGGVADYRRVLASMQRRRTEREVKREDEMRARNEERDERIKEYRVREEGTLDMLKELARQRFG